MSFAPTVRYRENEKRERRIKKVKRLSGEATKSGALDAALAHYIADHRNKSDLADDLPSDVCEELSTSWIPIERETTVGKGDD